MNYIIIEDEQLAARRLREMIESFRPEYKFIAKFDSIESTTISLPALKFDLLFMDIQLADGNSFDIFDQISIATPIIFTTAYDEYALKAFKHNSIDYLLKPIDPKELQSAIVKFEQGLKSSDSQNLDQLVRSLNPNGKERFVVKVGDHLKAIETKDVQLVYSQDKATYLFNADGKRFLVDYSLDRIEELLNKEDFFRISRKFIVNLHYIKDMISFTNSRLEIVMEHFGDEQIIVARERVSDFKRWLDR